MYMRVIMFTKKTYAKRILIDLDGVLNDYGKQPYDDNVIPDVREGAEEFLQKLCEVAELHLFTTRNKLLAVKWLIKNNLDKYFKNITDVKGKAFVYIDDRALCFDGDYDKMLDKVKNFKAYWKN